MDFSHDFDLSRSRSYDQVQVLKAVACIAGDLWIYILDREREESAKSFRIDLNSGSLARGRTSTNSESTGEDDMSQDVA